MFRFVVVIATLAAAVAFAPARFNARSQMTMAAEKNTFAKLVGAAFVASSIFGSGANAAEGAGAKLSFFGDDAASSPYTITENREDPIYSPYSAYGDGSASVYNKNFKGDAKEIAFWKNKFSVSEGRVANIPKFLAKKEWANINTELKSYAYNFREATNRLAASSKDTATATATAKAIFSDLNDIGEWSVKKNSAKVGAAYESAIKNIAAFKALI